MASLVIYLPIVAAVTCIKFLLIPSYRSTDFEVHRNWLAITHNLPISKWYVDKTSVWTLDYPPLFAWFEYLLSYGAKYFDPAMLAITNLNYASTNTILFQRLTVILSDFVYVYACFKFTQIYTFSKKKEVDPWFNRPSILAMLLLWNPGLFLIDHIHFQYNGFLNGIFFLALTKIVQEKFVAAAFLFSILLNLKHIYLYVAPVFFVYLLRNYCFTAFRQDGLPVLKSFRFLNFAKLGLAVSSVFAVSFGPFIYKGLTKDVLGRLFPFKNRGLTHAYWAPNFWALYNTADIGLVNVAVKVPFLNVTKSTSMTSGIVQEYGHQVLPTITPTITLFLTVATMLPILFKLFKTAKDPWIFTRSLVICAFCSFMFGWHVHEKAILMVILPFTLLAVLKFEEAKVYLFLSIVGHFSLFPLIPSETMIKIILFLLHSVYAVSALRKLYLKKDLFELFSKLEVTYLAGLVVIQLYHLSGFGTAKYRFLPLLIISTYCALGVSYAFIKLYHQFLYGYSDFPNIRKTLNIFKQKVPAKVK